MSPPFKHLMDRLSELVSDSKARLRRLFKSVRKPFQPRAERKLNQNWASGLSDYREEYTSVQLQHKASEWRSKIK